MSYQLISENSFGGNGKNAKKKMVEVKDGW